MSGQQQWQLLIRQLPAPGLYQCPGAGQQEPRSNGKILYTCPCSARNASKSIMGKHNKPKRITLAVGKEAIALYDTVCELQSQTREDGFRQWFHPWVEQVISELGKKPDADLRLLSVLEENLKIVFPADGYAG